MLGKLSNNLNDFSKALGFYDENNDPPLITQAGEFHIIEDREGRLHVMFELGEEANRNDLLRAYSQMKYWRKRLLIFQGPKSRGIKSYRQALARVSIEEGIKSREQAKNLNRFISRAVRRWHARWLEFRDMQEAEFQEWLHADDVRRSDSEDMAEAHDLLTVLGDKDPDQTLENAMKQIDGGSPPFAEGYPIDAEELRLKLLYERNQYYVKNPPDNSLEV